MFLQKILDYLNISNKNVIQSYKIMRRIIGILGIALPYVCIVGALILTNLEVQTSISVYYYSNMRDFFTGMMFIISLFLLTYKGYEKSDELITLITGITGLGLAVFPCLHLPEEIGKVGIFQLPQNISNVIHLSFAGTFIFLMAVNSIFLFTKTESDAKRKEKINRNRIYYSCGAIIILSLIGIVLSLFVLPKDFIARIRLILIFEILALNAFGFSWLVKGETLFRDRD